MGFLKNFSEPFAFALALWPFVSMLLTVPVLALLYHRDNRIRLSSAIVAYGTVLYLLGLLCFTLYPMPADAAAYCAAHHLTPQLNPLQFIGDIRTDGLTAVLQIAFNIVFFLPLGFIMGRIWRWPLPVTAVLSFATSLFLETMQLTGLMGVFPCAYRLFDVDDRSIAASAGYESVRGVADALADAFESMALDERANELYMSGTSHLAHSRPLADLAPLFDALEEQVVLMKLMSNLSEETNASGVGVAIGSEMHTPGLLHASVVSSGYGRSGAAGNDPVGEPETESETESQTNDTEPIAFVGSIGPTHMDYAATMAAVRAVARYLTAFLSEGRTQD